MKNYFSYCFLVFVFNAQFSYAQPDVNKQEMRDMIAICNSFTFIDLYKSDKAIIPKNYTKVYTSGVFGMDNRYQVYRNGKKAVIHFRGSTAKQISWLENMYASMIPAKGVIEADGDKFSYCFAHDTAAAVHAGYALGLAYLHKDLLERIQLLNNDGVFDIILTGHSQGGALANLVMAYLENLPAALVSPLTTFKTYAFAAPMTGNAAFAMEYDQRFCKSNLSYNVVNVADPIPTFPISYNDSTALKSGLMSMLFDKEQFNFKKTATDQGISIFEDKIGQMLHTLSESAQKRIANNLGDIQMPAYKKEYNYKPIGNRIEIPEAPYPKILRDSSILKNDSLMRLYTRNSKGEFADQKLYKKAPWGFQHKPYNYYVTILKTYFPHEYAKLERKYLPENL
jgi:hypothetical protein